jgi:hypothetical protein
MNQNNRTAQPNEMIAPKAIMVIGHEFASCLNSVLKYIRKAPTGASWLLIAPSFKGHSYGCLVLICANVTSGTLVRFFEVFGSAEKRLVRQTAALGTMGEPLDYPRVLKNAALVERHPDIGGFRFPGVLAGYGYGAGVAPLPSPRVGGFGRALVLVNVAPIPPANAPAPKPPRPLRIRCAAPERSRARSPPASVMSVGPIF